MINMESLLEIRRLSHVSLSAFDLVATERFYTEILGFQTVHEFLNGEGLRYGLFLYTGGGTFLEVFQSADLPDNRSILRHVCFETMDIHAFAEGLRKRGVTDFEIRRGRTDKVLQFFINGPDNVQIEIQQHDEMSLLYNYVNVKR